MACVRILADLSFGEGCADVFGKLYYFMFTICNIVMAIAPILLFIWQRAARKNKKWFPIVTWVACAYVIQFAFFWYDSLEIGYYVWAVSFVLMSVIWLRLYLSVLKMDSKDGNS